MIIIDHININSVRYKFESLFDLVNTNLDVLVISETKTDEMFQESQFIIEGFSEPYRKWWRGSLVCKGRCSYNAHRGEIISHLDTIGNILDKGTIEIQFCWVILKSKQRRNICLNLKVCTT